MYVKSFEFIKIFTSGNNICCLHQDCELADSRHGRNIWARTGAAKDRMAFVEWADGAVVAQDRNLGGGGRSWKPNQ